MIITSCLNVKDIKSHLIKIHTLKSAIFYKNELYDFLQTREIVTKVCFISNHIAKHISRNDTVLKGVNQACAILSFEPAYKSIYGKNF